MQSMREKITNPDPIHNAVNERKDQGAGANCAPAHSTHKAFTGRIVIRLIEIY